MKKEMRAGKKAAKSRLGIWVLGGMILALFLTYAGTAFFFSFRFLPGTIINGINASGKKVKDVEQQITREVNGYDITIEGREDQEGVIAGVDIALRPVFDGTLQKELKKQNGFAWLAALFQESVIEVDTMVEYDKEALKNKADELEMLDKKQMIKPKNAEISEYSKENGYTIIPEEEGTTVRRKKFFNALKKAILNLQDTLSLEEEDCYSKPKITQESEELKKQAASMNQYAQTTVTYQFGDQQEILNGELISQWISVGEDRQVQVSSEEIAAYVVRLADTWDTAGKSKNLKTSYGAEVTVEGGDYGWAIDREKETQALTELIQKGAVVTKEPEYKKTADSRGGNDYGSTYVEVNLTAQHLFYYKNGELVVESDFVSGNDAKGWSTPAGAFGLYYKQRDKTLRGEDYATPVSFWMPFNGGVGFHDANWRRSFGGNYYKRSGSHGCINLPYSAAKTLYENIEAGCPVLVYSLPGSESAKAQAQESAEPVIQAIGSLGEITPESRGAIENARNMYNALDDMAKSYVSNYPDLEAAEAAVAQAEAEAAADQQAQAEAQPVIDAINALAAGEITLEMKGQIQQIREQYNQLSEAARAKVINYSSLEKAEKILESLQKKQEETKEE